VTVDDGSKLAQQVGAQIRRLRRERGWSQQELSQRAGLVQQNLSAYERGAAKPRLDTLSHILDALGAEIRVVRRRGPDFEDGPAAGLSIEDLLAYVDRQVEKGLAERRRRSG
jgi:HTH-type transcriptional regulator / antitoxin HipB